MTDYSKLINQIHVGMPSSEYHGLKNSFSSSQLKDMLKDPEYFYRKHIAKTEERLEMPAFDVGTYFHTAVLEPHLLETECAVYTDGIRSGKKWEDFKLANAGKAIITAKEKGVADKMIQAVKESPIAMGLLSKCRPEISAFLEVFVSEGEVYRRNEAGWFCLHSVGWVPCSMDSDEESAILDFGVKLILKTRADALCMTEGFICDLKSTSGNCKDTYEMQSKVANYEYDFSAALYLDIFTAVTGFETDKFYWIFASKDIGNSKTFLASDRNIMVGRAKWKKAVVDLAKYVGNNWTFVDELGVIEPTFYNQEWLKA